jgi:WD40 repeat protein
VAILRDGCCKAIAVVLLVAAGLWYAMYPDLANEYLPLGATGNGPQGDNTHFVRVAWLPDGNRLLTLERCETCRSGYLVLHNLQTGASQELRVDPEGEAISTFSISPDGRHALVGTFSGHFWWIGLESDEQQSVIELAPRDGIATTAVSSDGRRVAVADDICRIMLCSIPPTPISSSATGRENPTASLEECPGAGSVTLEQDGRGISRDIRFSASGDRLLLAGNDGSLRVWDLKSGTLLQTFHAEQKPMTAAVFLPGEDRIMSSMLDDTIRIWSMRSGHEVWRGHFGLRGVTAMALSPDGKTAAWGGCNRKILLWNIELERTEVAIETPASMICNLQFSSDGNSLAAVGLKGPIRIYDAKTGAEQQAIDVRKM